MSPPPSTDGWTLDSQLAADTVPLGELALSSVRLVDDSQFPWVMLVPRRPGAVDLIDLAAADQALLTAEIDRVARALKAVTACDKLNVAALGNVVPQLHVHVIARRKNDLAWPKPVWNVAPPRPYTPDALADTCAALRAAIDFDKAA